LLAKTKEYLQNAQEYSEDFYKLMQMLLNPAMPTEAIDMVMAVKPDDTNTTERFIEQAVKNPNISGEALKEIILALFSNKHTSSGYVLSILKSILEHQKDKLNTSLIDLLTNPPEEIWSDDYVEMLARGINKGQLNYRVALQSLPAPQGNKVLETLLMDPKTKPNILEFIFARYDLRQKHNIKKSEITLWMAQHPNTPEDVLYNISQAFRGTQAGNIAERRLMEGRFVRPGLGETG